MSFIGIDVGGTFTDAVIYDETTGSLSAEKVPTTPDAPQRGLLEALERLNAPLGQVDRLVHGMTLATNAVLERKGASVWVVTNRGFRDTLEIARTNRPILYNIKTLKAAPLVSRDQIIEISERRLADGSVLRPVDEREVDMAIETLLSNNVKAVAICLLHSYIDPAHERAIAAKVRHALPDCFVTCSAEVLPEIREYERFATTALNAYTGPVVSDYLTSLEAAVGERGYTKPVYIMASNGGVSSASRAARLPVNTILSGPAGGVAAARALGEALDVRNLITYDMGGTSTDVCLLNDLVIPVTNEQFIAEYPNRTPQIAISAIGAGGGSLAIVEDGPLLRVGPESAGAVPGPACYGRGGECATVTDANLLLGRLNPHTTLGGSVRLDLARAEVAIDRLNRELPHLGRMELAEGIVRIAVARMVTAIKEISINEVHDPRDFALLPYGGAGPMHAAFIADELEISRIVIPPNPGNFSAYGAILSDVRHDHVRSYLTVLSDDTLAGDRPGLHGDGGAWPHADARRPDCARTHCRAPVLRHALRRSVLGTRDGVRPFDDVPRADCRHVWRSPQAALRAPRRGSDRDRQLAPGGHRHDTKTEAARRPGDRLNVRGPHGNTPILYRRRLAGGQRLRSHEARQRSTVRRTGPH